MQKTGPTTPGESRLIHRTLNAGRSAEFALSWRNYDPRAICTASRMFKTGEVVGGFRLERQPAGFTVWCASDRLSSNVVSMEPETITLTTEVLPGAAAADREMMKALADLEQCAAIALAWETGHIAIPVADMAN